MKIYVASSWINNYQPEVVEMLRKEGHEVFDFKNPPDGSGFSWSEIDDDWKNWSTLIYRLALEHEKSQAGFNTDFNAMKWADVCVLVMPCGRSAHIEAGWMAGAEKTVIAYIPEKAEPELMYKIFDMISDDMNEIIAYLEAVHQNMFIL